MGVMLFIMCFAKFPFGEALDPYYKRLQQNPAGYLKARKINCDPALLDLVVGMTREDPAKRYTMADIMSHNWFKGNTATPQEIRGHFYGVMPGKKVADYQQNQARKASYNKNVVVERGHEDYKGANTETAKYWSELDYKPFNSDIAMYSGQTGFFSKTLGVFLFSALSEYLVEREVEYEVSDSNWKMNITLQQPMDEFEDLDPIM